MRRSAVVVEMAESMHTDWRAHSIFDGCVAVGAGNVRRTVYKCRGLELFSPSLLASLLCLVLSLRLLL